MLANNRIKEVKYIFEKIREECLVTNTPLPEIEVTDDGVTIYCTPSEKYLKTLRKLNNNGGNNGGNDFANEELTANEILIISVLKENSNISQKALSELIDMPLRTVQRVISNLISKGIIERQGTTRKSFWIIKW